MLDEIEEPFVSANLTNVDILLGKAVQPIDRLRIMSNDDFEDMIQEWIYGFLKEEYVKVLRLGSSGDQGRDVIAYYDFENNLWDNFQCKHYNKTLNPSDIWVELGKLVYFTSQGEYTMPRKYFFVSSKGIGPKLENLFQNRDKFRQGLLENWDNNCKTKIISNNVELDQNLREYILNMDFNIFDHIPPLQLIDEHSKTIYHATRFGGGLKKRDISQITFDETDIKEFEMIYISELFRVYSELKNDLINSDDEIKTKYNDLYQHLYRQRESFYFADSLKQFARDNNLLESNSFEELKKEMFDAIIEVVENDFENGYARLQKVLEYSNSVILIESNPLTSYLNSKDRKGLCHHLVNDEKIVWVQR